jgi:hypothetical protein
MLTKSDFQQAITDSIDTYPAVAQLYRAGDPRILQALEAMAAMAAMLSSQIETSMAEPFDKARDATVLADAALKGIVRKALPARVNIKAVNGSERPFSISAETVLLDTNGLPYRVVTPATIPALGEATFDAEQGSVFTFSHTVSNSKPFYQIELPEAEDDSNLSAISVADAGGDFAYSQNFLNIAPNERVFHVETDEYQRIFLRFGFAGTVGFQPPDGHVLTIRLMRCHGDVRPSVGSPFAFEYTYTPQHSLLGLSMSALQAPGQNPPDMAVLRDLARYPSVYDDSAVYLGEFDFLIMRNFPGLKFLSVWSETLEEKIRGPSLDNINALFIAIVNADDAETMADSHKTIGSQNWTATQGAIARLISKADDSYKVRFIAAVPKPLGISVMATISANHDDAATRAQITQSLLAEYGQSAMRVRHGGFRPSHSEIHARLKKDVPALGDGFGDFKIDLDQSAYSPETWLFATPDSVIVNVSKANLATAAWGSA